MLADNYVKLRALNRKSKLSVAPSIFDWQGKRALAGPVFAPRNAQQSSLNARYAPVAEADIQLFYHSIYTHSIAWAIHGKAVTKKNRWDFSLCGNLIDLLVRNSQDGQTLGLPVGPDTSRLIAEIVGSAIDRTIQRSVKFPSSSGGGPATRIGMRFVDDYTFGCSTHPEAEKIIAIIRNAANTFELELNNSKTGPKQSSPNVSTGWREHLRELLPSKPATEDLNRYFYNIQLVCRDNPGSDVVKYALMIATRILLDAPDWRPVQDYLLSSYRQSGTTIPLLVEITVLRNIVRGDVQISLIGDFVNSRLTVLVDLLKHGEIAWLLFLAICLQLPIRPRIASRLAMIDNGVIALLMSDARKIGLIASNTNFKAWEAALTEETLNGPMWLYAYESARLSLNGSAGDGYVNAHPYFKSLLKQNVQFYRSGSGHFSAHEILRSRQLDALRQRLLALQVDDNLAEDIVDFEEEDYDINGDGDGDDVYA